jgi:hypothetical protein
MSFEWKEKYGVPEGEMSCDECGETHDLSYSTAFTSYKMALESFTDAGWKITYDEDKKCWYYYCPSCNQKF